MQELRRQGVDEQYIKKLEDIFRDSTTTIPKLRKKDQWNQN